MAKVFKHIAKVANFAKSGHTEMDASQKNWQFYRFEIEL